MHESSMAAMRRFVHDHLDGYRHRPLRVLDVGAMDVNGSYRVLFDDPLWEYTGVDLEAGPGVDIVLGSPYDWSAIRSGSFDVVVSGQAFEHIEFPWVTAMQVNRVLVEGGIFCMIVPSGGHEHRYPLDCWRYYPDGARALARWADLEVLSAETSWEPVMQYSDDSAAWADTVLVARKPMYRATPRRLAAAAKRAVLLRLLRVQGHLRSGSPAPHPDDDLQGASEPQRLRS